MNSYFYKFMINLLKRFSSERKLLETRGAFIIRSEHPTSLAKAPEHRLGRVGWGHQGQAARAPSSLGAKTISTSFLRSPAVLEQTVLAFHMSRHHISHSHPRRRSGSLLNSIVRARFVKKQLDQPEHEDRLGLRVPSRVNSSTRLGMMLTQQKPWPPKLCVLMLGLGSCCFGFLRSCRGGWKAKHCGSWQGIIFNAMKSGARDTNSWARWEIMSLMAGARWRNQ